MRLIQIIMIMMPLMQLMPSYAARSPSNYLYARNVAAKIRVLWATRGVFDRLSSSLPA